MKKLLSLRQHLLDAIPYYRQNPDRLLTFVAEGSTRFAKGDTLSHQLRYTAQIVMTDCSDSLDVVMLPVLHWLSHYQPDVDPERAVQYEAEILSNDAWDLELRVELTERIVANIDGEQGRITAEHRMPDYGRDCDSKRWLLVIRDAVTGNESEVANWPGFGNDR